MSSILSGLGPELLFGGSFVALAVLALARPRVVLLIALASLAFRPELLLGGDALSHAWGIQHTLLLAALIGCAWRYGLHREINWPILAFIGVFALSLLLGEVHPELTIQSMMSALGVLCLPWLFTQVALPPGSRRVFSLVLALLPTISLGVGFLLWLFDLGDGLLLHKEFEGTYRMVGPEGDPGLLAVLAFGGFAVALHESTRPGRPWAPILATLNLAIVILSVTRMGVLATLVLLLTYAALSPGLRERILRRRGLLALGCGILLALLAATLPSMLIRVTANQSWILSGGRDLIWPYYYEEFLASPIFGRGFGAGFLDIGHVPRKSPHNEYLHLLVIAGVVGLCLCLAAIALWFRQLLSRSSPNDREFVLALVPAIAMFAVSEDVMTLTGALVFWAYLGSLLTHPTFAPHHWAAEPGPDHPVGLEPVPRQPAPAQATYEHWPAWEAGPAAERGPRFGRLQQSLGDSPVIAPSEVVSRREKTAGQATVPAWPRPLPTFDAEPVEARAPPAANDGVDERAEPFHAEPQSGEASIRGHYWIMTFPITRRVLRVIGADRLASLLLIAVLASLAIDSEGLLGPDFLGIRSVTLHKLALLGTAGLMVLCFGLRLLPNWAVVAVVAILPLNLLLAEPLDGLSPLLMATTAVGLLLPWLFVHVVLDPYTRAHCIIALASAPIISAVIGSVTAMDWDFDRFAGATNAAFLGASGFIGFAVSVHQYSQRRRSLWTILAFLCPLIVIFSGSRMAWISTFVFIAILYLTSQNLRETIVTSYHLLLPGGVIVILAMAMYIPFMETRFFSFGLSGRQDVWPFFIDEFHRAPLFGRGLGATELLRHQYDMASTHNEYIRMLVDVGVSGFVIYLAGIVAWFRQLLRLLSRENRAFVWAMIPCLAMYGATDNILSMVAGLAVFVYLGMMVVDRSTGGHPPRHLRRTA